MIGKRQVSIARGLLCSVYALIILMMILGSPDHSVERSWSLHASVHLLQGLSWLVGLCIVDVIVVLKPLERGERWAWLLVSGIVVFGGFFAPAMYLVRRGADRRARSRDARSRLRDRTRCRLATPRASSQ